jgi:hypothetical protein
MPSGQPSCGSITNCFDYEYTKRIDNAKALCLDPTFGLKPGDIAPNSENAARKAAALYFIGGNANGQGDNYNGNSNCFQESQTKPSATAGLNAATKRSQDLPEEILGAARRERNKSPDVDWLHIKCAPCSDGDPCIQTLLLADLMNMNPDTSQGTFNVEVSNASVNVYGYSDGYAKVNYSLTIKCRARLFIFCDDANC